MLKLLQHVGFPQLIFQHLKAGGCFWKYSLSVFLKVFQRKKNQLRFVYDDLLIMSLDKLRFHGNLRVPPPPKATPPN